MPLCEGHGENSGQICSSTRTKKCAEESAALQGEQAGVDLDVMVQLRLVQHSEHAPAGTGLEVFGAVEEPGDTGVEDGAGAHGTGLKRAEEGAAEEAVVAERGSSLAERNDFCVGGGVGGSEHLVVAAAQDFTGC